MISVRSEVQVLPGPPFLVQVSGAVAQLGEHLLCKQGVVGSIPSGSTNTGGMGHLVIRLKESLRTASAFRLFCRHREEKICSGSAPTRGGPSLQTLNLQHMIGGLTAGHRTDLEKLVFLPIPSGAIPVGIGNENDQVS